MSDDKPSGDPAAELTLLAALARKHGFTLSSSESPPTAQSAAPAAPAKTDDFRTWTQADVDAARANGTFREAIAKHRAARYNVNSVFPARTPRPR
jgi:hypothetical protein